MAEVFFTLFLFIAITGVTAVLFGGWVVYAIVRTIVNAIVAISGGRRRRGGRDYRFHRAAQVSRGVMRACENHYCRTLNPTDARFCRRCGQHLPETQRVSLRRAA